jgi:hypothetical protein
LTSEVVADYSFFKAKYGPAVARTAIDLFKEYQVSYRDDRKSKKNVLGYFSPRRLEKVLDAFMQFQTAEIIANSLPDDIIVAHKHWAQRIEEAIVGVKKININPDECVSNAKELIKLGPSDLRKKPNAEPLLKTYSNLKALVNQQKKNQATDAIGNAVDANDMPAAPTVEEKLMYKLRTSTAAALNAGINTTRIIDEYSDIIRDFDQNQQKTLFQNWQYTKVANYNETLRQYLISNPDVLADPIVNIEENAKADPNEGQSINPTFNGATAQNLQQTANSILQQIIKAKP